MEFPAVDAAFVLLAATVFVAGAARGLSGFGDGLIIAPVAGAIYGPQSALAILVIIASLPTIPVTLPALRLARWGEVLPTAVGIVLCVPVGVLILKLADASLLRWIISLSILAAAATIWRGWRYSGQRTPPKSLAVGALSGVLSGIASIPGPPVLVYWLASELPASVIRANMLTLFFISEVASIASVWAAGLFTGPVVAVALMATPPYFAGLLVGQAAYGRTDDRLYRQITLVLIVVAAVAAIPWTDLGVLGSS